MVLIDLENNIINIYILLADLSIISYIEVQIETNK